MQIFLSILKVIGIAALVILGIILVLVLLLLFTPFVYRANVRREEALEASGSVAWLFRFLFVTFSFREGKLDWDVKVIGISLKNLLTGKGKKEKKKRKKKSKLEPGKKQPTIMPGEKADHKVVKEAKKAAKMEVRIQEGKAQPARSRYEEGEERTLLEKIKCKIIRIRDTLVTILHVYRAYAAVKDRLFKLVRHIMPQKVEGYAEFGFEDPSVTGKLLAILCMVYPIIPKKLELRPRFDEPVLACDLTVKGRFFLIYLLIHGLKIYFNKEVKIAMGRVKKKK